MNWQWYDNETKWVMPWVITAKCPCQTELGAVAPFVGSNLPQSQAVPSSWSTAPQAPVCRRDDLTDFPRLSNSHEGMGQILHSNRSNFFPLDLSQLACRRDEVCGFATDVKKLNDAPTWQPPTSTLRGGPRKSFDGWKWCCRGGQEHW